MRMNEQEFLAALKAKGIELSDKQLKQFNDYYETLIEWNEKMNLTSITDQEEVYLKHFYDSLTLSFDFDLKDQTLLDLGAGAGFPSIPLKIVYPELSVTIVDSLNKRITFLHHLFEVLGLEKCDAIAMRGEEYAAMHRESYDIVTARAVARFEILDELTLPLVKIGGYMIALKGAGGKEEYDQAKSGISKLGGKLEKEIAFTLPGHDDQRINYYIKKVKATPKTYPRAYAKMKKQPLK